MSTVKASASIARDRAAFLGKLDGFQYTKWALYGLHLALDEPVRLHSESFDPNIHRTLKWSMGAETMGDLLDQRSLVSVANAVALVEERAKSTSTRRDTAASSKPPIKRLSSG